MECLIRTSPVAVCGSITEYSFDKENSVFTLKYEQDKEYSSPTEIYVHKATAGIECDGEYSLEPIGDKGAAMLRITSAPGTHTVVIKF